MLADRLPPRRAPVAGLPEVKALAVFPFTVRGSADLAYLRGGMVDLLSAKLNGESGFRAVDPHAVLAASARDSAGFSDVARVSRVARAVGARWIVTGELVEIAGRLQISATVYDLDQGSRAVTTESVAGETTSLFQLVDDLTGHILAAVAGGRDSSLTRLSALTTRSLPALKAFLAGEEALRAGEDARAATRFRDAATLDTTFALAQYRLALAATWSSLPGVNAAEWSARAARHADRLAPVLRDLVRAYDAYRTLRADEAERIYRSIVQSRPDNVEAWMMLGEVWFHYNTFRGRSPAESRVAFERVLALDPANGHAELHLARLAALEGRVADLDTLVSAYAHTHGDAERLMEMRALSAYAHDDTAARRAVARAADQAADLTLASVVNAALAYAQNLDAADELVPAVSRSDREAAIVRVAEMPLTAAALARGVWIGNSPRAPLTNVIADPWLLESRALAAAEPSYGVPSPVVASLRDAIERTRHYPALVGSSTAMNPRTGDAMRLYLVGLLSARLGDFRKASDCAGALAGERDSARAPLASALATGVRAEILRSRGDNEGALRELERFPYDMERLADLSHYGTHERFLRGELLRATGRGQDALPWYESVIGAYDLPLVALSHLRRAQILDGSGDAVQARFHYARFVRMWSAADPERQSLVLGARQSLTRLGDQAR